ncbi:MAG: VCBS repeat-containing protein [Planctomycetes bacterium]|nr:VCBS repeat-containing protein [Planctomycetota bacterium]
MRTPASPTGLLAVLAAPFLCAAPVTAQQFQQATNFPGTALWSEGLEACDVDRDGDLDLFVADGGNFNAAGVARQNLLWINQTIQGVPFGLVDESVARLGVHTSHAKGVTTGDIDGNGWDDALFVNAFFTSPPNLYVNRGAAQPGVFDFVGPARGLTTSMSSGAGMFADLDDDGDLDLVLDDRYNSATAAPARLYLNDGAGFFTEQPTLLNAPSRSLQMDVQLADVDGDWDFDVLLINKGGGTAGQVLLRNDGAANFTDASALLAAGNGSVYEAEVGDLDGDLDLDLFFTSLSGFAEGVVRNNLAQNGALSFASQPTFGADDDNEIALFDYDLDGDYDVFVGSLRNGSEKLYRNNGGLSFTDQSAQVQNTADSTLDLTLADLDNDGRYDLVTVQGESGSFVNKFLKNTGPADTLPPVFTATQAPTNPPATGPWVVRAKVRDQVLDDGVDYVSGSASYVVLAATLEAALAVQPGGAFSSASLAVGAGARLTFTNASGTGVSLACQTAPYAFASTLPDGGTFEVVLVEPGAYTFQNQTNATSTTVTVSGATTAGAWRKAGPQIQRYTLSDTLAGAGVRVAYELRARDWPGNLRAVTGWFDLTPTSTGSAYCAGDGSAAACPCGNSGAAGRGCASSVNANGARLAATGAASLSADTLVLSGSGMPNSSALYFQGTVRTNGGLGSAFGDGLRCAGGSVVRLGTKSNVAGASGYPAAGDPGVATRGLVGAPGTRTYQVWYRNAAAFCTADTFNLSNGLEVAWGA